MSRIAFSIDIYKTPLLESIELLNKYTHVNNDTFDIPEADVIKFSRSVIDAFSKFLMGINDCRALVVEEIFDEIDVSLIQYSLDRNIAEVDILSTHYNVESIYIEEVLVTGIKSDAIILSANGTINIHQQYGSDGDVSSGDGVEWDTSFPFNSKLKTDLRYPLKKSEMKVVAFEVDTNDWYD